MKFYKISKFESARRQLETAIKLFFNDEDYVSIHTLAAAANQVLVDLAKEGGILTIEDVYLRYIKKDKHKEFINKVREAQNFFKHADRDPGADLSFNSEMNDIYLMNVTAVYEQLSDNLPFWIHSYKVWFLMNNFDLFDTLNEPHFSKLYEMSQKKYTKLDYIKLRREADTLII